MLRTATIALSLCLFGCAPDVRIRGQVLDADGGTVAGAAVRISRGDSLQETGADGRFEFGLSLDDAAYTDPISLAVVPLSVWVGELNGEHSCVEFSVTRGGTLNLPPLVEWQGTFELSDAGVE